MTRQELITLLRAELKEELEGIIKYNEMYEAAKDIGWNDAARTIERIACDEWAHANYLREMILDHEELLSPEIIALWDKAGAVFNE